MASRVVGFSLLCATGILCIALGLYDSRAKAAPTPTKTHHLTTKQASTDQALSPKISSQEVDERNNQEEPRVSHPREETSNLDDPSLPLKTRLLKLISQRSPRPYLALHALIRERLKEAGLILIDIINDPSHKIQTRRAAISLLADHDIPHAHEALISVVDEEMLRPYAIDALGSFQGLRSSDYLIRLYPNAADELEKARIITALGHAGDPAGLPLIEALLERSRPPDAKVQEAEDLRRQDADRAKRQIMIANSQDPISPAVQLLYDDDSEMRTWALAFLKRKNPPTLALHLRASMDTSKQWPDWKRNRERHYQFQLLFALRSIGGALTESEERFLTQYDPHSPPPLPK